MHLRDCEGLEFDEIAAITHQSEAAVRVALSRARQKVKQQLLNIINNGE
jgi:RNA polymerase sigma-70 factor (ECF subfamily)